MKYTEEELLPVSALQHLEFCPRQCALIHIERLWDENRLTAQGRILHERTHSTHGEVRNGVRVARSLRLHSFSLGLVGQADVVEFHRLPDDDLDGVSLDGISGRWRVFPVEYKRGAPKRNYCDIVQLCAQAICLEEMLGAEIEKGALFYGKRRRRQEIMFTDDIRNRTIEAAGRLHRLIAKGITPKARYENKCRSCSLLHYCMPKVTGVERNIDRYMSGFRPGKEAKQR